MLILSLQCTRNTDTIVNSIPVLTTADIIDITTSTAMSGGNITDNGGANVTARGVCWSTSANPTTANTKTTDGNGSGVFTSSITGLSNNTTYHVRAYATNSAGTAYGDDISFTTGTAITTPTITTIALSAITATTASSGGNITDNGGANVTARGVCWSISTNPTIANTKTTDGTGSGTFTSSITGLSNNTTYHVRAYATNSAGTAYGDDISFTTGTAITTPTITTTALSAITATTASSGGNITDNGGANVTARGVCWSTSSNPTIANTKTTDGNGSGAFTSSITGLTANTTYHVRAYATNSAGTAYGNDISFTTSTTISNCGTVTDIDGNVYNTVTIGTQCWMKENLKTTRYNDGTAIPTGLSDAAWQNTTSGAYAIYDNNAANNTTYGKLYNWYAVNTGKLAPAGWHVPTDAEWSTLTNYLGGVVVASGAMKATTLWNSPNTGATNSSGFTGLPAGFRSINGAFNNIGYFGSFWSSTEYDAYYAWYRYLFYSSSFAYRGYLDKRNGFSVRCVRD